MPELSGKDGCRLTGPVRKVTNCGTKKNIGLFSSYKNMTGIWYESLIERDYMYLLESDPDVLSYRTQPLKIIYTWDNKPKKYTPDFLVERSSRTQIVEIKPASQVDSDKNQRLWRCVAPNCLERGWEFAVVTDDPTSSTKLYSRKFYNQFLICVGTRLIGVGCQHRFT